MIDYSSTLKCVKDLIAKLNLQKFQTLFTPIMVSNKEFIENNY